MKRRLYIALLFIFCIIFFYEISHHKPVVNVARKIHVNYEIPTILHQSWKIRDLPKVSSAPKATIVDSS